MIAGARYRGQPLLTLLILLGGWIGLRAILWESPFARDIEPTTVLAIGPRKVARERMTRPDSHRLAAPNSARRQSDPPAFVSAWAMTAEPHAPTDASAAAGPQQLANLAIASQFSGPADFAETVPAAAPFQPALPPQAPGVGRRWSADAWLLLRKDTTTAVTSGRGSYGQSQAGLILRYGLAPASAFRPAVYLRASQALAGAREREAALGASARPIPRVPVSAAAEVRATQVGSSVHLRPAIYAVTELTPFHLPLDFIGEAYAQAGYVWGDYRTGFADGQLRVERRLAQFGRAELRAGGGVWGGAQKGAKRLDVGPSATLAAKLGPAPLRISLDWRFRTAGTANPASGPSLTLATGF